MQELKNKIMKRKKILFNVEKTDTGFSAYAVDYPIFTTGRSIPELINNVQEATQFYFEEKKVKISPHDIKFQIDFNQFFKHYKILNIKFLAQRTGINTNLLSQYIAGTQKPSAKQTEKILNELHQIGEELSVINLLKPF